MTPDDVRKRANDSGDARMAGILRALADVAEAAKEVNQQVKAFAEKYGEADFYTGALTAALARLSELK